MHFWHVDRVGVHTSRWTPSAQPQELKIKIKVMLFVGQGLCDAGLHGVDRLAVPGERGKLQHPV